MGNILLNGHKVAGGEAEGEALVSTQPISFMSGMNTESGEVIEKGHCLEGVSVTQKILVFPVGKGSTMGSFRLYEMALNKTQPKGIINLRADPVVAAGAIIADIPMVDRIDISQIGTGDAVTIEGAVVEIGRPGAHP